MEGSTGHLHIHDGRVDVHEGPAPAEPTARFTTDVETFVGVGTGELEPFEAMAEERLTVEGDLEAVVRLLSLAEMGSAARPVT